MSEITCSVQLEDDGSLVIPRKIVEGLGLQPGDQVQVRIEAANGVDPAEDLEQARLQAKFERFFDDMEALVFEKPTEFPHGDQTETAFTEIMDKKYKKLGFKP